MVTSCARWTHCWNGVLIARARRPMPARIAARPVAPEIAGRRGVFLIVAHRPMPALTAILAGGALMEPRRATLTAGIQANKCALTDSLPPAPRRAH